MSARLRTLLGILAALVYLLPWGIIFGRSLLRLSLGTDILLLYPAGQSVWQWQNPYQQAGGFFNPPWILLLIAPLSLLPVLPAYVVWTCMGVGAYLLAFRRMGMSWSTSLILLFSPLAVGNLITGNYDWLILLGATLPPAVGIWFLALKPQLGSVLAAGWAWLAAKKGWRALAVLVLPIVTVLLISYLVGYRLPPTSQMRWSADIWPWGIPVGATLTYFAWRRQDALLALAAAPFLSPYVAWHSWIAVLLPLSRNRWAMGAGILASWIFSGWVFSH